MSFLHIMLNEKFTDGVVDFYDAYLNNGNHVIGYLDADFLANHKEKYTIPAIAVELTGNRFKDLKYYILLQNKYDYIVFHSLPSLQMISPLIYFLPVGYFKKSIWIEWGGDLYDDRKGLKAILRNRFKKNVGTFIAIFPPDIDKYKELFPDSKAKIYYAPYEVNRTVDEEYNKKYTISKLEQHLKIRNTVFIQIGQNRNKMLNHESALRILSRFNDKDIKVLLPLSYGGEESYADYIQNYAEKLFPEKNIVLRKMMSKEEYFDFLQDVDIAIFYTYRQAGLSNIYHLLWRKVKVYLPENSIMYNYFISRGAPVYSIESIDNGTFDDFISPPKNIDDNKYEKFWEEVTNKEWISRKWNDIFEKIDRKGLD